MGIDPKELGRRVRRLRTARKQTIKEVAALIGADDTTVWRVETGRFKSPTVGLVTALAGVFDVTVDDLTGQPNGPNNGQGKPASFTEDAGSGKQSDDLDRLVEDLFDPEATVLFYPPNESTPRRVLPSDLRLAAERYQRHLAEGDDEGKAQHG